MAEPGCSGCYWSQTGGNKDRLASDSFYNLKPRLRSRIFDSETDLAGVESLSHVYCSDDERLDEYFKHSCQIDGSSFRRRPQSCKQSERDQTDRWGLCWQDVRSLPRVGGRKFRESRNNFTSGSNRGRGVLSWLNLMSDTEPKHRNKKYKLKLQNEFDSAADIFVGLDQITFADSEIDVSGIGNIQELQASHQGARSDFVDDILECTLDLHHQEQPMLAGVNPRRGLAVSATSKHKSSRGRQSLQDRQGRTDTGVADEEGHKSMPFIQSIDNKQVLVGRVEPLHLSRAMRRREHVLHCYEFKLMLRLDQDPELWTKLCDRFGHCDECQTQSSKEGSCSTSSNQHSQMHTHTEMFRGITMNPDLWFLAVTIEKSKDKLIHFIRNEMPRRITRPENVPAFMVPRAEQTFLSAFLNTFNFVELRLDSILEYGVDLSSCIYQCKNVKILSLKNNFLQRISPEIGNLIALEKLYLTHNQLQIKSIPYTLTFCRNLKEAFFDNNLFNALPSLLLRIRSLQRVHRHGNHNYFKDTFMFYHTDINDRILEVTSNNAPVVKMKSLQEIAGESVLRSRQNYYSASVPTRLKQFLTQLTVDIELCDHCSRVLFLPDTHFKVFTFKNPYLGNTCVPFQHTACSLQCAEAIEVPARIEQLMSARQQDSEYQEYIRESLLHLNERQNSVGALSDSFCSRTSRSSRRSTVTRVDTTYSLISPQMSRSNSNHSLRQSQKSCLIF